MVAVTKKPCVSRKSYTGFFRDDKSENRLINASNQTHQISYSYDYMGRRFQKVVDDGATVTTNTFLYDGWNLISEVSHDGSSVTTNHYVWGLELSGSRRRAGGIGGLLATVQDGDVYFSCFDANGNLTDYVDQNGSNVAHYVYGPFGGTISATGDMKDNFNFRFSTKYLDDELGWYYYGYRFYSPELGRWPSHDPLGEVGGSHLYSYAVNSPVDRTDLLGLLPFPSPGVPGFPTGGFDLLWELLYYTLHSAEYYKYASIDRFWYYCDCELDIPRETCPEIVCKESTCQWKLYDHQVIEELAAQATVVKETKYLVHMLRNWGLVLPTPPLPVPIPDPTTTDNWDDPWWAKIETYTRWTWKPIRLDLKDEFDGPCNCDNMAAVDYIEAVGYYYEVYTPWKLIYEWKNQNVIGGPW